MGRTNNLAKSIAAMQTMKMIAAVDSTSLRVKAATGANASEVSILVITVHRNPGRSAGAYACSVSWPR